MKNQFRKGFVQNSKNGKFYIKVIKIGTDKIALKEGFLEKVVSPKKPFEKKTDLVITKI